SWEPSEEHARHWDRVEFTASEEIPIMLRRTLIATGPIAALGAAILQPAAAAEHSPSSSSGKVTETREALRDLWSEHIFWVRNVVWALVGKQPKAAAVAEAQVVANARQIAD